MTMVKPEQMEAIYRFFLSYAGNPRISIKKLHKESSPYKRSNTTSNLLHRARENQILIGPFLYCNTGFTVNLLSGVDDPIELFEKKIKKDSVTYAVCFEGSHSLLYFEKGASTLKYAEAIAPSFPAKKGIEEITLEKTGELPIDPYPHGWRRIDWEIYKCMRNPLTSFPKVAEEIGVSWKTVKNHFEKIKKYCKTWIALFPQGYRGYSQSFLAFKTDFEVGLREELQKLDRTSFLYKFDDTILLNLFYDHSLQHYTFSKLQKKGKIQDLHVSIPVRYHTVYYP